MFIFFVGYIVPNLYLLQSQLETIIGRFVLWQKGLLYLVEHPTKIFVGIGVGKYAETIGEFYTAHNVYILHLVELGIFSFFALIYFVLKWLVVLYRLYSKSISPFKRKIYKGLFLAFFVYFFHDFIEHSFFSVIFLSLTVFWVGYVYILEFKTGGDDETGVEGFGRTG